MDKILFNRIACLGIDVLGQFSIVQRPVIAYNQQKVRVDYFMQIKDGTLNRPSLKELDRFLLRSKPYVKQQENMPWLSGAKPNCIYMDSFAELTDQIFVHKKTNKAFCCTYTDIKHAPEFKLNHDYRGLLDDNDIHNWYEKFFTYLRQEYDVPIVFIHFPTTFDHRYTFKDRGKAILESINQIESKYDIINISADDSEIEHAKKTPTDKSPYHFSDRTKRNIANKLAGHKWIT